MTLLDEAYELCSNDRNALGSPPEGLNVIQAMMTRRRHHDDATARLEQRGAGVHGDDVSGGNGCGGGDDGVVLEREKIN